MALGLHDVKYPDPALAGKPECTQCGMTLDAILAEIKAYGTSPCPGVPWTKSPNPPPANAWIVVKADGTKVLTPHVPPSTPDVDICANCGKTAGQVLNEVERDGQSYCEIASFTMPPKTKYAAARIDKAAPPAKLERIPEDLARRAPRRCYACDAFHGDAPCPYVSGKARP